ncbi:MAG: hypothetical protein AB8B82_00100 [Roseovarius sp.]
MRFSLSGALLALTTALGTPLPAHADPEATKLVTILTSADPQTQLMSMVLTMHSIKQGASGYVLLCGPAGDLALKDPPASALAPQNPKGMSPQVLMQNIMAKGGQVEVCAIYLPNKGVAPDALLNGVGLAKPRPMAARLLADDTRIMSF